jgi:hypothetical protein
MFVLGGITTLVAVAGISIWSSVRSIDCCSVRVTRVPIPSTACPYLRVVRDAATAARDGLFGRHDTPASWKAFSQQLNEFDGALREAVPKVPPRVATKLREVVRQVDIGRAEVPHAHTDTEYQQQIGDAAFDGYFALADVSTLVGPACGFTVAPDPFPFTIPNRSGTTLAP